MCYADRLPPLSACKRRLSARKHWNLSLLASMRSNFLRHESTRLGMVRPGMVSATVINFRHLAASKSQRSIPTAIGWEAEEWKEVEKSSFREASNSAKDFGTWFEAGLMRCKSLQVWWGLNVSGFADCPPPKGLLLLPMFCTPQAIVYDDDGWCKNGS